MFVIGVVLLVMGVVALVITIFATFGKRDRLSPWLGGISVAILLATGIALMNTDQASVSAIQLTVLGLGAVLGVSIFLLSVIVFGRSIGVFSSESQSP